MEESVKQKFTTYPDEIAILLHSLRDLILSVAEKDGISDINETLKWGEPSYISKIGSTIRFDWKITSPQQYCIYFNCQTKLVETFKEVYGEKFRFEKNRAIVLSIHEIVPSKELSHCLSMALRYKKLKHLDLLGA